MFLSGKIEEVKKKMVLSAESYIYLHKSKHKIVRAQKQCKRMAAAIEWSSSEWECFGASSVRHVVDHKAINGSNLAITFFCNNRLRESFSHFQR